jgi:hypothetical protein
MKPIKSVIVHPYIGNDQRSDVIDWCYKSFNDSYALDENDFRWFSRSNYERSHEGTFDVYFKSLADAEWFILRWGGNIVGIEYEDVPEKFVVREDVFKTLFE